MCHFYLFNLLLWKILKAFIDFPGSSDGKESACSAEDPGLITGLGRSPEEENGNPLQYSFLENSTDRGALWATVHGFAESDMTEQLTHKHKSKIQGQYENEMIKSIIVREIKR